MLMVLSTLPVSASDSSKVALTDELVIQMADRFAKAACTDAEVTANNPIKFYDTNGQAIGYIVNYYNEGVPYGYVVFDSTSNALISEYSFGEDAKNPYEVINKEEVSTFDSTSDTSKLYKLSPFTYGVINNNGDISTNYGESLSKSTFSFYESKGKDPTTWDEVFLDIVEVYEDYSLISTNHLAQFIAYNEALIESQTGHYACAVSALLACATYYGVNDFLDIPGDYMDIWNATSTTTYSESNGIVYGSTLIPNIGHGFVNFCSSRNFTVSQNTRYDPGYQFFTNCIDGSNIAVVHCGIIDHTNERSGHSMAVEGYATLRANNSGNTVDTLMVFDGWGDGVRYLNFDFDNWADIAGTTFNG